MAAPYLGEIRMFAGSFPPSGNAFCDGELLQIDQHKELFSLFGAVYGGDWYSYFGLPDLRGRLPIHRGSGPGLPYIEFGSSSSGGETHTIVTAEMPAHGHTPQVAKDDGDSPAPVGRLPAVAPVSAYSAAAPGTNLASTAIDDAAGGGQRHNNVMPFQCINFIVALLGHYPELNSGKDHVDPVRR